jgi:hypothetical protein
MAGDSATVPGGDRASLQFTQQRKDVWAAAGAAIGLTLAETDALTASNDEAQAALDNRIAQAALAKSSTITWKASAKTNRDRARDMVRKIRTFALEQEDPAAVYALAQIPEPKTPGDLPEPAVPTDLSVSLNTQGRAVLTFESTRYGGTVWTVERRTASTQGTLTPWVLAGTTLERSFTDTATPGGVAAVHYRVRAERPSGASNFSTPIVLPFGAQGNQASAQSEAQDTAGAISPAPPVDTQAG